MPTPASLVVPPSYYSWRAPQPQYTRGPMPATQTVPDPSKATDEEIERRLDLLDKQLKTLREKMNDPPTIRDGRKESGK